MLVFIGLKLDLRCAMNPVDISLESVVDQLIVRHLHNLFDVLDVVLVIIDK